MISSIQIEGYRGFERFEMTNLGRLNLLVGVNNSGKTSVLEALYLLTSRGDPMALWQLLWRRGERLPGERNNRNPNPELDVCHLFTGHETHVGSKFTLSARNQTPERSVTFTIAELSSKERKELIEAGEAGIVTSRPVLQIKGHPRPPVPVLQLTRAGGMSSEALEQRRIRRKAEGVPAQFITTESLDSDDLVLLWDKVALTPDENLVLRALQFLDPDIERIAAQSTNSGYFGYPMRGGFIIKRRGHEQPIPIGSMGDGMWRMMAMAIAITQCKGGVLLIDEIDTGLHYAVMSDMWKLIYGAAKVLDVQIFATTHSFDCIHSLASVCLSDHDADNVVTLQRIEPAKARAIPYSENEIRVAAEKNIEVR
jgi:hypothetical protein